jgi:hypothetical protein
MFRNPVHKLTHGEMAKYCTPRLWIGSVHDYADSRNSKLFAGQQFH